MGWQKRVIVMLFCLTNFCFALASSDTNNLSHFNRNGWWKRGAVKKEKEKRRCHKKKEEEGQAQVFVEGDSDWLLARE